MPRLLSVAVLTAVVLAGVALGFASCSREPERRAALTEKPLPARAVVEGTRFVRLDPAQTGLQFTNELHPGNVVAYVYSGAGCTVGDYDGDGLPDVYLVSQDGPNKLFRQTSPMHFTDVTASAGGLDGGEAWGTAATFADVDGDGDLDLYVCNLESPNLLYQNQGDGTFVERAATFGLAITAASMGAAFADYDNDGDLDLYLVTNRVFGPRLPPEIVAEVTLPKSIAKTRLQLFPKIPDLAEFTGKDGKRRVPEGLEDFVAIQDDHLFPAGQPDRLLRNDGYAQFRDVTASAGIHDHGNGLSAVWWDCDDDGLLDLYVGNDLQSPDRLYHNRGDGTFEDIAGVALPHLAFFGMGCDFGDLDNDGHQDLCIADMSSTTHYWGKMLMGNMGNHRWFLMNADPQQYMRNSVFLGTGTGRFREGAHLLGLASSDWTWAVRFADLDDDGRLDFFATNGIPSFEDDPDAALRIKELWQQGKHDQALDVVRHLKPVPEKNVARRNDGDLHFTDVGAAWGLDETGVAHGAVVADLDRDGDLDVVVVNQNQAASVFENRGSDAHRVLVELRQGSGNRFGVGARIELTAGGVAQSRIVSLTRGYMSAGEAIEHFGLGAATTIDALVVRWPDGAVQRLEKLAADRHYVIDRDGDGPGSAQAPAAKASAAATPAAASGAGTGPEACWFADGDAIAVRHKERDFDDYALQPLLPHRLSRLGPGVAVGDVDGDGRDDLFVGGAAGDAGTLLLARGAGFEKRPGPWQQDAECEDLGALLFDADGDGDLDLYVASGGVEAGQRTERLADRLYRNDGHGRFERAADALTPDTRSSSCVCAADFDGDGDLDLLVGGRVVPGRFPEAPPSALLRNDGGRFVDVTKDLAPALLTAGMVTGAAWTDVDGDGRPDLVVAAQWQALRVLRNDNGRLVDESEARGLTAHGQWNGVTAADLDGDGDLDLIATNLGLDTKYKVKPGHPLRLFARDFDQSGVLDVVEAKYQGDTLLPVRGRSCSSEAMPFLAQRFPTYDQFARASLGEIYGPDELAKSLELSCDELQSCVYENQGGHFVLRPLPRIAQIAPGFGIGVDDFDGDGRLDAVLAQNSFSPEPETGHFDGGLGQLLAGRGDLSFDAVEPLRSGIVVPQDQKALAVLDVDGDRAPDVVVATNDGPVRTLRNRSAAPRLRVRLQGTAGNVAAIGARVELVVGESRQVREVRAGDGYLSQSSASVTFANVPAGARIAVRWPDGQRTEHAVEQTAGDLVLKR